MGQGHQGQTGPAEPGRDIVGDHDGPALEVAGHDAGEIRVGREMGIAQPQGLGVRAQRAVAHTGQMLGPGWAAPPRVPVRIVRGGAY